MGGNELLPNFTLLIQMVIFFGCYFMLNKFVFGPYMALLDARRAKTVGLKEKAAADKVRAEALKTQYETFIRGERKNLNAMVEEERKKVGDEERTIIQESRSALSKALQALRERLQLDVEKAREDLAPLLIEYSSEIASKVVGRKVKVPLSAGRERENHESPVVPG